MNNPRPATPIQAENSTAVRIANETIKQSIFKATNMQLYWIWCRIKQDKFIVYWKPVKDNLGDYPTKHHSPAHHSMFCPVYLHGKKVSIVMLQGCVNSSISARTA